MSKEHSKIGQRDIKKVYSAVGVSYLAKKCTETTQKYIGKDVKECGLRYYSILQNFDKYYYNYDSNVLNIALFSTQKTTNKSWLRCHSKLYIEV